MAAKAKGLDKRPGARVVTTGMLVKSLGHILSAVQEDLTKRDARIEALEARVRALESISIPSFVVGANEYGAFNVYRNSGAPCADEPSQPSSPSFWSRVRDYFRF